MSELPPPVTVELTGVERSFLVAGGHLKVLAGVDLTIHAGEIVVIAGRSGSGKTTLLSILAGWDQPDAGEITLLSGAEPTRLTWREVAMVPQALGLLDELTVRENVALPGRLGRDDRHGDVQGLLERLGLEHLADRFPSEISLGEQQRTALARAAVAQPHILVADEPIAHQNAAWAESTMALLRDLAASGTTCVVATHNQVAFASASRVLPLHDGRLAQE